MSGHLTWRVTSLTCVACGERQRVRIRLIGEVEVMPNCESCGACEWISLPKLAEPKALPSPLPALMMHSQYGYDRALPRGWS